MPLPWTPGKGGTIIPNVEDRAMTWSQLRALRCFLQRLCRNGLLKQTSDFAKTLGNYSKPIDWFDLNMYDISNEVITKVIPFVDPEGERSASNRRWYSWCEFVSTEPQPAEIMVSHSWAGSFSDFMETISRLVDDKSLSAYSRIWICTFANCQFGEDFGVKLLECPFIKAVSKSLLTVLIVDRQAGCLERCWCGLELHYSILKQKQLNIYTVAGRAGAQGVSSGPLVEAVKDWDVCKGEATEAAFRRQILNFIAGVDESFGMQVDEAGNLLVKDGRPSLADDAQERDPSASVRLNGEAEYSHESKLFKTFQGKFEDLNKLVRMNVIGNFPESCASGCNIADPKLRGLTLGQIRTFLKQMRGRFEAKANISEVVDGYVKPETHDRQCSYMELVANSAQAPQYIIDHVWKAPLQDTGSAVELFAQAQHLPDSTVFWWDMLSLNQHNLTGDFGGNSPNQVFTSVHEECRGKIVCCTPGLGTFRRGWVLHGLFDSTRCGKGVYLGCTSGVLACNMPFRDGSWEFGNFDREVAQECFDVKVEDAATSMPHDLDIILQDIAGSSDPSVRQTKFAQLDNRLARWTSGTLLRAAAAENASDRISLICKRPGFRINSESMKGSLGETALHVAVRASSTQAIKTLLEARMDPNIEDDISERPLHYAALSGCAEAALELLAGGADPWAESHFGETAFDVAAQAPASFLKQGGDVAAVLAIIQEAQLRATN